MILVVEDDRALARHYATILEEVGYPVTIAETGREALRQMDAASPPRGMLLDIRLPDIDGLEVLTEVRHRALPMAVVVATAHGSVNTAVSAMRAGADDFLVKPFDRDRLLFTLRHALERLSLRGEVRRLRTETGRPAFHRFIGASLAMQGVYRLIEAAADSGATVFITGESGTGKELCAEALHRQGNRAKHAFVAINCGAIPRDLMESEIFGHVKGAFTGAVQARAGAASRADGGTLFLDEVGELPPDLQTKLLRFLQTGRVRPVGADVDQAVSCRIVCATNRDPWAEVRAGRFREDLYYRLHVIPIHLPPLRERGDDALEIARALLVHFAAEEGKRFSGFTAAAEARLLACLWPGNVRQLENVIRTVVVLNDGELVEEGMLVAAMGEGQGAPVDPPGPTLDGAGQQHASGSSAGIAPGTGSTAAIRPLWQVEREAIERAIAACDGNIPRAAAHLEVSASTIYRKRQVWAERDGAAE
ncbi:sigma-54-dependent transcriptional regulator [Roseospira visakhapatnamensis]|uniref:DNA-binding NtrC family response regulator n=1 Tax=Roseospira visakhapatnamensis TaxID=390880 RepID=A0A7W6WB42_9PROT|nr:sigma-54 dependent transcriptional regulator [Roseospira visakhapatnamensis]MBB4267664.1 DNA-binding NtrC family response regulator [Roseospira visakhapatnamensis]